MDGRYGSKKRRASNFKSICIILMLLTGPGTDRLLVNAGMAEGLTEGLKYAGQMFGINTAADVADLVAKAFLNAATTTAQKKPNIFSMLFPKATTSAESGEHDLQQQATYKKGSHQQETDSNEKSDNDVPPAKESAPFNLSSSQILTGVLRMVGFDARKLGALAINVLVMVTHAIGTTLLSAFTRKPHAPSSFDNGLKFTKKSGIPATEPEGDSSQDYSEYRPRQLRSGSPVDWFLHNPTDDMKRLLSYAIDKKLVEDLIVMLEDSEKTLPGGQNNIDCLKMLVCKSSPFIWRMQESVEKRLNGTIDQDNEDGPEKNGRIDDIRILDTSVFSKNLPTYKEFKEHSSVCDQRYGEKCRRKDVRK